MQTTTPHITNTGEKMDGMQSYVNAAMLFLGFSGLKPNVDKSSVLLAPALWQQHQTSTPYRGNTSCPDLVA
jgi:hypothetical protein